MTERTRDEDEGGTFCIHDISIKDPCDDCDTDSYMELEGEVVEDGKEEERPLVDILLNVPDGHPDHWEQLEWSQYEDAINYASYEEWMQVEQIVFTRSCGECDQKHADSWYPGVGGGDWTEVDDKDYLDSLSESKDLHSMTDDEFVKFMEESDSLPTEKDEPKNVGPAKGSPCLDNCRGPGWDETHPDEKRQMFATHLDKCPQHPEYDPTKNYSKTSYSTSNYKSCKHDREAFKLEDNLSIFASAWRDVKYAADQNVFDVGVYMYDSWQVGVTVTAGLNVPWSGHDVAKQVILDWPDFNIPDKDVPMVEIVKWMLAQMGEGVRFETGCMGGHGRTGTMLACLLAAQGVAPGTALKRVRAEHCDKAIENQKQGEYVATFYKMFHGDEAWTKNDDENKLFEEQIKLGHKQTKSHGSWSGGSNGYTQSAAIWNNKLGLWTCKSYRPDYKWDKELKLYTAENDPSDQAKDDKDASEKPATLDIWQGYWD